MPPIPPAGIAIIVGFIVILIICIIVDKNGNAKFKKKIEEQYPTKETFDRAYVTENGELLFRWESGTVLGYKKWNLSDIAYIATFKGEFSFSDKDGNTLRGEYLTPSKKPVKEKGYATFYVGIDKVKNYVAFVKKHGPHIQHTVGGKVVED